MFKSFFGRIIPAVIVAVTVFVSCSKEEIRPEIAFAKSALTFECNSSTKQYSFECNTGWTVSCSDGWCEVTPLSGTGDGALKVKVGDNFTTLSREAEITITVEGGEEYSVNVFQSGFSDDFNIVSYAKANPVKYELVSSQTYTLGDVYTQYTDVIDQASGFVKLDVTALLTAKIQQMTGSEEPEKLPFVKAVLNFTGTDTQGREVQQSGVLCYSPDSKSISELLMIAHGTIGRNSECPSLNGFWPRGLMAVVPGFLLCSADYLGFGKSSSEVHPYLNEEVTAKSQVDFTVAAVEYLESIGMKFDSVKDGFASYSVGASQGGAGALATHRAIERDDFLTAASGFKGSYCCDGPYDMWATLSSYRELDYIEIPCAIPMIIMSMFTSYPDIFNGMEMKDCLSDALKDSDIFEWVGSKLYSNEEINSRIIAKAGGASPDDILSPEVLDDNSAISKALKKACDINNLADGSWYPHNKAVFHHSVNDHMVPYSNLESIKKAFPAGSYVESSRSLSLDNHFYECVYFYFTFTYNCWRVDVKF